MDLLNYASLKWGRWCIPDGGNQTRRELSPLWIEIRRMIDEWTFNYDGQAARQYDFRPDLSLPSLNALAGRIAGVMARAGIQERKGEPVSLDEVLELFRIAGISLPEKAQQKWEIVSRLLVGSEETN